MMKKFGGQNMNYVSEKKDVVVLECECGNEIVKVSLDRDYGDDLAIVGFYQDLFSSRQEPPSKWKILWKILTKGDYFLYEICLRKKDVAILRDSLTKFLEEPEKPQF